MADMRPAIREHAGRETCSRRFGLESGRQQRISRLMLGLPCSKTGSTLNPQLRQPDKAIPLFVTSICAIEHCELPHGDESLEWTAGIIGSF